MELSALIAEIQSLTVAAKTELMGLLQADIDEKEQNADEAWHAEIMRQVNAIRNGDVALREPRDR